jgi:hypothetical protein
MSQGSLFDTTPKGEDFYGSPADAKKLSRRSDPATSHKAADDIAIKLTGKRKKFFDTLKLITSGSDKCPRTAMEVAANAFPYVEGTPAPQITQQRETLRKRAKELVRGGFIRECEARTCKVNLNDATTYEVIKKDN